MVRVAGRSPEQRRFASTSNCPRCGRYVVNPRFSLPDGTRISGATLLPLMDKRAVATCPKCGGSWPVFESAAGSGAAPVRVVETERVDEPIGEEVRRIDNSGPAGAVRRIRVVRRWARHVEFGDQHSESSSSVVATSSVLPVGFGAAAHETLGHYFGGGVQDERVFEEEIELSVPPGTTVELVLHWKRVWQLGFVVGGDPAVRVPFRAVVGLTFDQVTR